jgi:hypothetical protein
MGIAGKKVPLNFSLEAAVHEGRRDSEEIQEIRY